MTSCSSVRASMAAIVRCGRLCGLFFVAIAFAPWFGSNADLGAVFAVLGFLREEIKPPSVVEMDGRAGGPTALAIREPVKVHACDGASDQIPCAYTHMASLSSASSPTM